MGTGLRASELASLTPQSFDLESDPPTARILAKNEKARRGDSPPLPPSLVDVPCILTHKRESSPVKAKMKKPPRNQGVSRWFQRRGRESLNYGLTAYCLSRFTLEFVGVVYVSSTTRLIIFWSHLRTRTPQKCHKGDFFVYDLSWQVSLVWPDHYEATPEEWITPLLLLSNQPFGFQQTPSVVRRPCG